MSNFARFRRSEAPRGARAGEFPAGAIEQLALPMLENVPLNVMYADEQFIIRYVNPASLATLRAIEQHLPVRADEIVGSSIDVFHKVPQHQRTLLSTPGRLPHKADIQVGPERLQLHVSEVRAADGNRCGWMVNWSVVTKQAEIAEQVESMSSAVAAALEQLQASITEIAAAAAQSAEIAQDAAERSTRAVDAMTRLHDGTAKIDDVVKFIASVADETNLLALNATIEAARAGDAGKGFAVVANEVKDLAAETDKATGDIRDSVHAVQSDAVAARALLEEVLSIVHSARDTAASIAAAVEQQSATVAEIGMQASRSAEAVRSQLG